MTPPSTRARPSTVELLRDFRDYQRRRNLSASTITHRQHRVTAFAMHLARQSPPIHLLDASSTDINAWIDTLHLGAATHYTYLTYLAAFYRWAIRADLTLHNPTDRIERPRKSHYLPRPTDDDELSIAIQYADARMAAWLYLTAFTGARCIEIARLRGEDINTRTMTIMLRGKGAKDRVVPLHAQALAALRAYGLPSSGPVFTRARDGQPLSPSTISRYIGRHMHALGSSSTAHCNRHWFATRVQAEGGDLLVTRDLLGHASTATTEVYTKLVGDRGRGLVDGLGFAS